ncbi:MAG: lipoyl(octanoyl) transferase LipB, partial [Candidatus Tectomicrobia bacterium]|nr:lipoyl(octanoyl) transferase LipB [Candidatus Tectomicrobia bacterium]
MTARARILTMQLIRMGIVDYREALEMQRGLAQARIHGEIEDTLLLLQHPPTLTIGRAGKRQHLLVDEETLRNHHMCLYEVERGGDITYHGPGQLVGYPILDLNGHGRDAHRYLRRLEEVLIETLNAFDIQAERRAGWTGVWVGHRK